MEYSFIKSRCANDNQSINSVVKTDKQ